MTEAASKRGRWVEFFIPLLPGRALSPNGAHGHWSGVSKARQELREATSVYLRRSWRQWGVWESPAIDPVRVSLTLMRTNKNPRDGYYRPKDVPNAVSALKPVYDGLQDAGLIVDDSAEHMILGEHRIEIVETLEEEGILVRIEEVEAPNV